MMLAPANWLAGDRTKKALVCVQVLSLKSEGLFFVCKIVSGASSILIL
jgi:hypothetical protein